MFKIIIFISITAAIAIMPLLTEKAYAEQIGINNMNIAVEGFYLNTSYPESGKIIFSNKNNSLFSNKEMLEKIKFPLLQAGILSELEQKRRFRNMLKLI